MTSAGQAAKRGGHVERAVRAELRSLRVSVQSDGLGAAAVALAQKIDSSKGAAAVALASAQLRQLLTDFRESAAARSDEGDPIDELGRDELAARRTG